MSASCARSVEVAEAAASGRWPERASAELRAHTGQCHECREMARAVAAAVGQEAADLAARVPSAAHVWWRLAVRARLEREHAAARPVVWLQGLAGACGVGLVAALIGRGWPSAEQTLTSLQAWVERLAPAVPRAVLPATEPLLMLVLAASGTLAVATIVAAAFIWLVDD